MTLTRTFTPNAAGNMIVNLGPIIGGLTYKCTWTCNVYDTAAATVTGVADFTNAPAYPDGFKLLFKSDRYTADEILTVSGRLAGTPTEGKITFTLTPANTTTLLNSGLRRGDGLAYWVDGEGNENPIASTRWHVGGAA